MKTIGYLLKLPWLARIPSGLGLTTTVLTSMVFSSLAIERIHALDGLQQLGAGALMFAVMVVWTQAPGVLWLARDSNSLRAPAAAREADGCLLLYAALSILLPALVLGTVFGHMLTWLVSLALVASTVFALCVLPIWIAWGGVLACFAVPVLLGHVPVPGDPRFLAWATPVTIALLAASLQRWRMLRHAASSDMHRWWMPGIEAQRTGRMRMLVGGTFTPATTARYASSRKLQITRLSQRAGPDHPVRSIRLAISPLASPNAQRGLRQSILIGGIATVVFLVLLFQQAIPAPARDWLAHSLLLFGILFLYGGFGGLVTGIAARWSGQHGELAVLTLLPRLGTPAVCRRATLLSGLQSAATWSASVLVVVGLVAVALHEPAALYPLLLIVAISGLAFDAATLMHVFAGRPLRGILRYVPRVSLVTLLIVSVVLWAMALPDGSSRSVSPHGAIWISAIIGLWTAWMALMLALAWRGWRLLQRRPHPFLANPPH